VKFPENSPNKCVVGDVTNGDIWRRTAGDLALIKMVKERVKVNIIMTYSRNATFASLLDIYKRIALGGRRVQSQTQGLLSTRAMGIKRRLFQIKVGLHGIAVMLRRNRERENTTEMGQMIIVVLATQE
jgi:hypothetical protein